MTNFRILILAALLVWLPAVSAWAQDQDPPEFKHPDVIRRAVEQFYVPAYKDFVGEAHRMHGEMAKFCQDPSAASLEAARAAFIRLVTIWSRAEVIRFGPVLNFGRLERIVFWPDVRGIGARQYRRLMLSRDPDALNFETLRQKSVAVQSMTALERVLFNKASENLTSKTDSAAFTCAYGTAVAANVAYQGKRVSDEWSISPSYAEYMLNPGFHTPIYLDSNSVAAALIGTFTFALEFLRDSKVYGPLGRVPGRAKPKRTQWRLSGLGLRSLVINVRALKDLYTISGLGTILPNGDRWIASSILANFELAAELLEDLDTSLPEAVGDPAYRDRLIYFGKLMRNLQRLMGEETPRALGVVLGFEWVDGD